MNAVVPFLISEEEEANANSMLVNVQRAIGSARTAQCGWTECLLSQRLKIIRRARLLIVEEAALLTEAANHFRQRPPAEILTSEVVPLAAACRFLEDESGRILRERRLRWRRRPLWLSGVHSEIQREPHGLILIIAPSNYPLFLPAVQTLQALVAGNAVLIKPGDNGSRAAQAFVELLHRAGLPQNLAHVLPEEAIAARSAIELGIDKVILTGSASTGQAVLAQCAKTLTPTTVELSGCDAVFVRADADLNLVVRALRFGLRLNNGATCIAPRRVFVNRDLVSELETRLRSAIFETSLILDPRLLGCVTDALVAGADFVRGNIQSDGRLLSVPIILSAVAPSMRIACEDICAGPFAYSGC